MARSMARSHPRTATTAPKSHHLPGLIPAAPAAHAQSILGPLVEGVVDPLADAAGGVLMGAGQAVATLPESHQPCNLRARRLRDGLRLGQMREEPRPGGVAYVDSLR
jgi:hypothetical protein